MQQFPLGRSGLSVAPWALGANVFGWTADRSMTFRLIDEFVERGFNLIDTANTYPPRGVKGTSEQLIGEWLAQGGGRRQKVVIATKVGEPMPEGGGLSAAYIRAEVERSLARLGTDVIDLYQAHLDDAETPLAETLEAFDGLIRAGKVRAIGASNYSAARLTEAATISRDRGYTGFSTLQPWYNLYDRDLYEGPLQATAEAQGLGVLPYFGLASGFLTGKYRTDADLAGAARGYRVKPMLNPRGFRILAALDAVGAEVGGTPAQIALAWLRAKGCVPIASATSPAQLAELAGSVNLVLDPAAIDALDAASRLLPGEDPGRVPLPSTPARAS